EAALEVVLIVHALELPHERGLVGRGDVVDADRLADALDDGLRELFDVAFGADGVLDLFIADLRGVDGHEGLVSLDEVDGTPEHERVEDDVAVHPEHAGLARGAEAAQKALRRVRLVVTLVVHIVDVREGLDDRLGPVADDRRDASVVAERGADVVVLLSHDRTAVPELCQRLREGATESRAHARSENDGLKSHRTAPVACVHGRFIDGTLLRAA
ncbi:hypothetical protein ABE10_02410, partial [Bacillus toyonensis]|nr:hypothetical protein [Bacillus toyonensis]